MRASALLGSSEGLGVQREHHLSGSYKTEHPPDSKLSSSSSLPDHLYLHWLLPSITNSHDSDDKSSTWSNSAPS